MISPLITTRKLILRPFKNEDVALWQVWDIDSEVQAHMPEPKNVVQDIREQYAYIKECEDDPEGYYWSIESNDGTTVGTVSLFEINAHHGIGNVGILIGDKNYRGKGVGKEVISTVVQYAFEYLNMCRISAEVEEANIPMITLLEQVGFTKDGIFLNARIKEGKRINVLHFGICK